MPRLFVAIDLPEAIKQEIATIPRAISKARWVPPDQLHLTLRFIGDTDDALAAQLAERLARIDAPTFSLAIKGIGHFPPRAMARVLWLGLETSPPLAALQIKIERVCIEFGLPPGGQRFSPHVTIARLKNVGFSEVAEFESSSPSLSSATFNVCDFHLYASYLTSSGAIHRRVASFALNPG